VLETLLGGDLYYRKSDGRFLRAQREGRQYRIADLLTGADLGSASRREVRRVGINNRMRSAIKTALAGLRLTDPDPQVRLSAVQEMLDGLDPAAGERLRARLPREHDPQVRELMQTAIAVLDMGSPDRERRLAAIAEARGSLQPPVRGALRDLLEGEQDPEVRRQAAAALELSELKVRAYGWLETLFFGLSLGSVLVLAAIGLAITFGVMGVINMAHGELIMLGAYTTYLMQQLMPNHMGLALVLAIPAAFLVSGLVGVVIERGAIRFLYGRPLETLLATFGISLVLQQLVRTLISPQNVPVANPDWMSGAIEVNSVLSLTVNRLAIIAFALLVFAALALLLRRTTLGLQVRAVSQNRPMARAMGVRAGRVDALTFGLGAGVAGVAGVALSQLTNVGPNLGQAYIVDSFMVVVFGGVGNLWGTLVGGLTLGVANKVLEPWSGAVLAKILVLAFIILFIQKRPRGLFPQKGRAAEA
jgi:urea transport system permease protein